jgi:crotonobetainyl-CoA:carnitine CoA-transferase CaiB-like acyl-CoA transferase
MLDIATAEAFVQCVGIPVIMGYIWKRPRMRYGVLDYGLCPYGFFKCKDGYVAIACFRDQDFRAALKVLKRWDLEEDWRTLLDRITDDVEKAKGLNKEIAETVSKYTYEEINSKFTEYSYKSARNKWSGGGLPVTTRMLSPEDVMQEEHWKVRKSFAEVDSKSSGKILVPMAGKMSETSPRIKWIATEIGKDNDYIKKKYGLC